MRFPRLAATLALGLTMAPVHGAPRQGPNDAAGRPRVIVSTDIGGTDPDDLQSMVHFLF